METAIILDAVRQDIKKAEEGLAKLRAVEEYLKEKAELNGNVGTLFKFKAGSRGTRKEERQAPKPKQADFAKQILSDLGRPAKIAEIVDIALAKGYTRINSKRRVLENGVYGAMARRKDLFVLVAPGTWSLVGKDAKAFAGKENKAFA